MELVSVEDYDMWLRMASKYPIEFIDQPLVKYRRHIQGISKNISRSYLGELKVLKKNQKIFESLYPTGKSLMSKRLHQLFFEFGQEYFTLGQIPEARDQFRRAVKHWPYSLRSWYYYGLSLLSNKQVMFLRNIKRGAVKCGVIIHVCHIF